MAEGKNYGRELGSYLKEHNITHKKFGEMIGRSRTTVGDYIAGRIRIDNISKSVRKSIYEKTGIESWHPERETTKEAYEKPESDYRDVLAVLRAISSKTSDLARHLATQTPARDGVEALKALDLTPEERAQRVEEMFYMFAEELETLKNDPKTRRMLREKINPKDIGYVTAFLNHIWREGDKGDTGRWFFSSEYPIKKKGR